MYCCLGKETLEGSNHFCYCLLWIFFFKQKRTECTFSNTSLWISLPLGLYTIQICIPNKGLKKMRLSALFTLDAVMQRHRRWFECRVCCDVSVYVFGYWRQAEGIQRDLHFPLQRSHSVAGRHKLSALKKSIKRKERYSMSKVCLFSLYTAWSSHLQRITETKWPEVVNFQWSFSNSCTVHPLNGKIFASKLHIIQYIIKEILPFLDGSERNTSPKNVNFVILSSSSCCSKPDKFLLLNIKDVLKNCVKKLVPIDLHCIAKKYNGSQWETKLFGTTWGWVKGWQNVFLARLSDYPLKAFHCLYE